MGFSYDYNELSSEVLFDLYHKGNMSAFTTLLERHKKMIFGLIFRYIRNTSQAEEVFQDVFYKICKNKDQFRESVSFKSWIATIAKNTSIDFLRKQKKELGTLSLDEMPHSGLDRPLNEQLKDENTANPLDVANFKSEDASINDLLDELPVEQKETFVMKVMMDMTFEEIAESMNVSVNTAKSRHRYALKALRSILKRRETLAQANSL